MKQIIDALRPRALDELGLLAALEHFAAAAAAPGTQIVAATPRAGPISIESYYCRLQIMLPPAVGAAFSRERWAATRRTLTQSGVRGMEFR
ncbi:MAG: hypothetical protein ACJ8CR_23890 [Roseiflexaceae bacterium]